MTFQTSTEEGNLGKDYLEHKVFHGLNTYSEFYDTLSSSITGFISSGIREMFNLDTYAYSSMSGTWDSIHDVLKKGRINDAYALLRKYHDSTMINAYSAAYLLDNLDLNNLIIGKIENWRNGSESIPSFKHITSYIERCSRLRPLNNVLGLGLDDRYKRIRKRCNEHMHYNFYQHMLLNDNQLYIPERVKFLDVFCFDLESLFIQHFSYVFYLNDHYMSSSDYRDALEIGLTPEEGSENFVAPFIQRAFNEILKVKRPDIANEILRNTGMGLK
jgi:hypothetical protein